MSKQDIPGFGSVPVEGEQKQTRKQSIEGADSVSVWDAGRAEEETTGVDRFWDEDTYANKMGD